MRSSTHVAHGAGARVSAVFDRLLARPDRMRIGIIAMLAMSLLYTLVSVFLASIPGTPNPPPFLRIPDERYFYWASYFYAVVLLSGWVFGSALTQLAARALGGTGAFEDSFALLGSATAVATLFALVPDLLLTFPQAIGLMDYDPWFFSVTHRGAWFYLVWIYLALYLLAFCVFYPLAARTVHRLSWPRAVAAGWLGFVGYQAFIFVFIR